MMEPENKIKRLRQIFREMESAVVTLSGGVDSALLAKIAFDELGDRALALTAISPSLASTEREEVERLAAEIGIPHLLVETREMDNESYTANPSNRCYYCKDELFSVASREARERGYAFVVEGTHSEDLQGHRPGFQAAEERGTRSPFVEAGIGKKEIRDMAKAVGLSNWDKPSLACLASRFPTGTEITLDRLNRIDRVEAALGRAGARQFRARYQDKSVRLELSEEDFRRIFDPNFREAALKAGGEEGFSRVLADLSPYGAKRGHVLEMPLDEDERVERARSLFANSGSHCPDDSTGLSVRIEENALVIKPSAEKAAEFFEDDAVRNDLVARCRDWGIERVVLDLDFAEEKQLARTSD